MKIIDFSNRKKM